MTESRHINILEERRSRRHLCGVQEGRIEHPVSIWRAINVTAALVSSVGLSAVEQVYQRAAIVKAVATSVFQQSREVVYASGKTDVRATLIRRMFNDAHTVTG